MHQIRNTGALYSCGHRFATLFNQCLNYWYYCTTNSSLYQRIVTGQYVKLTGNQAAEAASGDIQSSIHGSLPAFGMDPVFLQGSNFYNPDMVPQTGGLVCAQDCPHVRM